MFICYFYSYYSFYTVLNIPISIIIISIIITRCIFWREGFRVQGLVGGGVGGLSYSSGFRVLLAFALRSSAFLGPESGGYHVGKPPLTAAFVASAAARPLKAETLDSLS